MIEFFGEFFGRIGSFAAGTSSDVVRVVSRRETRSVLVGIDNDDLSSYLHLSPGDEDSVSVIAHDLATTGAAPTMRTMLSEVFSSSYVPNQSSSNRVASMHRKGGCHCRACRSVRGHRGQMSPGGYQQYPRLPPDSPFVRRNNASNQPAPPVPAPPPPPPPPPPPTLYQKNFALAIRRKREDGGAGEGVVVTPLKGRNNKPDMPNCAMPLAEIMGGLRRLKKTGRFTPHGGMIKTTNPKPETPKNLIESAILFKFRNTRASPEDQKNNEFDELTPIKSAISTTTTTQSLSSAVASNSPSSAAVPATTTSEEHSGEKPLSFGAPDHSPSTAEIEAGIIIDEADEKCAPP